MDEVLNYIKDNTDLYSNDYVVIGLSGGPDSMALLDILIQYKKIIGFDIICAHVHHNIRKESDYEANFVKDYCEKKNIIFEMTKFNYAEKFTESLGHKMRYEYFKKIIDKYNAKYLFTAHHGDDLVETILMKIVRGASLSGYLGFESIIKNENYITLRPLVFVTKDDILDYNKKRNIPYVLDISNNDESYTRNRYRKYLLPRLKEEDKNVHLKFLEFSNTLKEYQDYVSSSCEKIYDSIISNQKLNISQLKKNERIIVKAIIYRWLSNIYKDNINLINKKHIDSLIKIIESNKPNMELDLPNLRIVKQYDKLSIEKNVIKYEYEYIINKETILPNGKKILMVDKSNISNNYVTYLYSNDIRLPLYVRNIKHGDKMTIKNMNGHKKIKDILINEKINVEDRINCPVVVDSNGEIIWLPGIKKSSFDSKNNGKYDIILEYH